jgi:hypothetical protein
MNVSAMDHGRIGIKMRGGKSSCGDDQCERDKYTVSSQRI